MLVKMHGKRLMSLVLVLMLAMAFLPPATAFTNESFTIEVGTITEPVDPGAAGIVIPVTIANNPGVAGALLEVLVGSPYISVTEISKGEALSSSGTGVFLPNMENLFFAWDGDSFYGTGEWFTLTVDVAANAPGGRHDIGLRLVGNRARNVADELAQAVPADIVPGGIYVTGDVNAPLPVAGGDTITEGGEYRITTGSTGIITIDTDEPVTLIGNGVEFTRNPNVINSVAFSNLRIHCAVPGATLTLRNVGINNTEHGYNTIQFTGAGNTLTLEGTNLIDHAGPGAAGGHAGIHVPWNAELTVLGTGALYLFSGGTGSAIGGQCSQYNGTITFGAIGQPGPTLFVRSTQQSAVIGTGAHNNPLTGTRGVISFLSGEYHILSNARGAGVGGGAGQVSLPGGEVVIGRDARVDLHLNFTAAGIGGGGPASGTMTNADGGTVTINGGSIRTFIAPNAFNTGWRTSINNPAGFPTAEAPGLSSVGITAAKVGPQGQALHLLRFDTGLLETQPADGIFTVNSGNSVIYSGGLHRYFSISREGVLFNWIPYGPYVDEATDIGAEYEGFKSKDTNLYFFLPEDTAVLTVNGETFNVAFDADILGTYEEHTSGPFIVTKAAGGVATLGALIEKSKAVVTANYSVSSASHFEGVLSAARAVLADTDATQEEIENAVTSLQWTLDALIPIPWSVDNPAPWDGTQDTDWFLTLTEAERAEPGRVFDISTAEQLAGLALIVNSGIDNFAGRIIRLTADVDLGGIEVERGGLSACGTVFTWPVWEGREWVPISTDTAARGFSPENPPPVANPPRFEGTFDGGYNLISNMYIPILTLDPRNGDAITGDDVGVNNRLGLFGEIVGDGTVKNVVIASGFVHAGRHSAAIVGRIDNGGNGGVFNSANYATVVGLGEQGTGGIVGAIFQQAANTANTENNFNAGLIVTRGQRTGIHVSPGGIVGANQSPLANSLNLGRGGRIDPGNPANYPWGFFTGTVINHNRAGAAIPFQDHLGGITGPRNNGPVTNSHSLTYLASEAGFPQRISTFAANAADPQTFVTNSTMIGDPNAMKTQEFVDMLNAGGNAFVLPPAYINNGFPLLRGMFEQWPTVSRLREILAERIRYAERLRDDTLVYRDGVDIPAGRYQTTQADRDIFQAAIDRARDVYNRSGR